MGGELTILSEQKQQKNYLNCELEQLAKKYIDGDVTVFNALLKKFEPIINSVIFNKRYLKSNLYLDDLRQECCLEVYSKLKFWLPERGSLKNFMFKCFSNTVTNYLKRNCAVNNEQPTDGVFKILQRTTHKTVESTNFVGHDLDMSFESRFISIRDQYIISVISISVYLHFYEAMRKRILKFLQQMTGYTKSRVTLLVDYTLIRMRINFWRRYAGSDFELRIK